MLTANGRIWVANRIANTVAAGPVHVAIGIGSTPPDENQTGLVFEIGRAQANVRTESNRVIYDAIIVTNQDGILAEIGLFAGTMMISRSVMQGRYIRSGIPVFAQVVLEVRSA